MGNSFRRLFIREGWKPLISDKVRCAWGFVSMGFCCYWYSDQISPVPASALNFSWDIKCIKSLLLEDWQKMWHNLNVILGQVNPLLYEFQLPSSLQPSSCHPCMIHSLDPCPSSVLCFRDCFAALQKNWEPEFHFVVCILKTRRVFSTGI